MSAIAMDEVLHLSNLKLPKGVHLTIDVADGSHDAPVVSIHMPRGNAVEESEEVAPTAVPTINAEKNEE
jgi:large subunit ribosomal protein L25